MKDELQLAATATPLDGDEPPREILLIPAGRIPTRPHDGRPAWHNPHPAAVVAATDELRLDLPIDYEHQTQRAAANGKPAPAAGWITQTFVRDKAVWGKVEWTQKARKFLRGREYRYTSASFYHDRDRVVKRVAGAALTNDPALFMPAIASASHTQEDNMKPEELRKLLGLPPEATAEQVQTAAKAAAAAVPALAALTKALGLEDGVAGDQALATLKAGTDALAGVAAAVGLDKTATTDEILAAVKAKTGGGNSAPDPAAFVPRSEFVQIATQLKTLQDSGVEEKATAAVDAVIAEGKITPASRDHYLAMAKSDLKQFESLAQTLPVIVQPGRIQDLAGNPSRRDKDAPLTKEELAVCRNTGIDPKQYRETLNANSEVAA